MASQLENVAISRIEFSIPWPPDTAYAYLVSAEEPVLVDAGALGNTGWAELTSGLDAAGHDPEDVEHLLITHPHTDHAGQAERLIDVAEPTVYAPAGVRERLARDPEDLASVVRANATEVGVPEPEDAVSQAVDSLERNRSCLPPASIDVDVDAGTTLEVGELTVDPIHVPGHQVDQMAFRTGRVLFSGDTLIEPFRPAALHVGFDRGHDESIDAFYAGLDRLAAVDVDHVYPGHGPVFDDAAGAVERARNDLDSLVAECRRTLSTLGRATAYEVTEARIDDPRRMNFSVFETVGSLARLERQGVVDSTLENGVRRYRLTA